MPRSHRSESAEWRRTFRRRLVAWYRRSARDLPWRRSRDPYRVWVSEIMLQQTQVSTVEPYFRRFVDALPTVDALAAADEQQVLRLWEGLGYYRRARQMHAAAQRIVAEHGGRFPRDRAAMRRLPGIGRYTAGAVLSIAFDLREPILEANSTRVLTRVVAYRDDPTRTAGQRRLWQLAEALLPRRHPGTFNQALMELGSEVCTARSPDCDRCPLETLCLARAGNLQDELPRRKASQPLTAVREAAVIVQHRKRLLLLQCGPDGRWSGLWDFPRFPITSDHRGGVRKELVDRVRELTGVTVRPARHIATMQHGVTRFRITLECHTAHYASGRRRPQGDRPVEWVRPAHLVDLPLSTTGRKLSRLAAEFVRAGGA